MGTEPTTIKRPGWVLGALAFGLYYTVAVAYFEPFHVEGFREQLVGAGMGATLGFYLPVALMLVVVSLALFRLQIRAHRQEGRRAIVLRWVALPLGAYAVTVALLWLYGWANAGNGADLGALGRNLLGVVALVGLLPLQLLLLSWPRRGNAVDAGTAQIQGGNARNAVSGQSQTVNAGNAGIGQNQGPDAAQERSPSLASDESLGKSDLLMQEKEASPHPSFRLQPSHGESTFEIPARDLILAEAADNYCKLYYLVDGQSRTKMVRVTMRDVEAALSGLTGYHRCHRSFLVNAAMVEAVQGQSQAYRLKVRHVPEPVPVSRSFDVEQLRVI
ncbi:MAG: LytTR family DNA-binding domain-containing protein [Bacteroidia bacterium]